MKKVIPKSNDYMEDRPMEQTKKKKQEKIYPKFTVRHENIPESKTMEVGKTYKIEMKVKVVGLSISRYSNDTELEIREYEIEKSKKMV